LKTPGRIRETVTLFPQSQNKRESKIIKERGRKRERERGERKERESKREREKKKEAVDFSVSETARNRPMRNKARARNFSENVDRVYSLLFLRKKKEPNRNPSSSARRSPERRIRPFAKAATLIRSALARMIGERVASETVISICSAGPTLGRRGVRSKE
jgi:hypothetical protein